MIPKISVIIPVYNVEKYLDRCVSSVLGQTLTELEIILVDDGSPDNCPQMCDEYKLKESRIKVIHKENGGLSSARNAGMNVATGKYIFFLDSDDWLEPDGMEHLYNLAEKHKVDFVRYRAIRTGWPGLPENAPCMLEQPREIAGGFYDRQRILSEIYPKLLVTPQMTLGPILGAWGALYRNEFLKANLLTFYEDIKFSEDVVFSASVLRCTNSFYYDDTAGVYHYFYNSNSISKSFKATRWESCKQLISYSYRDFEKDETYDFRKQLNILNWFCIMLSLGERRHLTNRRSRQQYCQKIMTDRLVKECKFEPKWYKVSVKQKLFMLLVKLNLWWFIAEV